ncbi:putative aryl-alcohol dehydrogenase [Bimuria novae-zelandiae CBS 107.79]|uniref:Putative aryl-alcohol dehydrogenase n=1 Tax=Bimuria novae-zelandiae CBS 107.79 TaxID=1447943 RepID=A0A6A5VMG3_9PLEO|nr:putative aryl-alcohol dehydrogenase [Bimuria novae-zelandiae CBS 107.79]
MSSKESKQYDMIIVGGGTAGLVAAARLSEDGSKNILVIEAGEDRRGDPRIDTPGLLMSLWGDVTYDWGFWTEPQEYLGGRQIPQPRGKVLGGSSAINVTATVYPTKRNFDSWEALGNKGWSFKELAPYYRKCHTFYPASPETHELLSLDYMNPDNQGKDGPVRVCFPSGTYGPYQKAWMSAFKGAGVGNDRDPILGGKVGAFIPPNTVDPSTYQRSYAASAYFTPDIERRPNLSLLNTTFVNRILLRESDGSLEAYGVEARAGDGSTYNIYAKSIILAAGAFQSPLILESSGIGSKHVLEQHSIPVLKHLPGVGENLQDHCFTTVSFEAADGQMTMDAARDPELVKTLLKQYTETRTGPLTGVPYSLAFAPPVDFQGRIEQSKIESLASEYLVSGGKSLEAGMKTQYDELRSTMLDPAESTCWYGLTPAQVDTSGHRTSMAQSVSPSRPENYVTISIGLNHPLSRGHVHISSPFGTEPRIDPKYLSHPLDLEILARGVQFVEKLVSQPGLKQLLKVDHRVPQEAGSLDDIEKAKQIAKDRLWTSYHPSCTCAMMPEALGGVVNDRLVVHGTKNLRVIDASIFPMIPLGNIQTTVYAVAERACDLIKEDWAA